MPRKKPSKVDFHSYESPNKNEKPYIRLPKYMAFHPNFLNLSDRAKMLYIYMRLWSNGKPTILFAAALARNFGMDSKTFRKSRDELVEHGFIEYLNSHCAADMRQTGQYQFSSRWWSGVQPKLYDID